MALPFVGVFVFARLGLYRAVVRYLGTQAMMAVAKGVVLLSLLLFAAAYIWSPFDMPRSIPIDFALVAMLYVGGNRLLVRGYYQWLIRHYAEKEQVIIYGAGGAGAQLAIALNGGREFYVSAFLDDDKSLWNTSVMGPFRILLALPSASKRDRKRAPVHVQTVPSKPEIVSGEASVDQFREVEIEDFCLGRF